MSQEPKPYKILIIRFGAIGDVVHSSIISQSIKTHHPDAEIHFMTSASIAPVLSRNTDISKLYYFDMKKKDNPIYLLKLGLELKKEKYDFVINLQNSLRNQFLSYMTGAKYIPRAHSPKHSTDNFYPTAPAVYPDCQKPKELKLYTDEKEIEKIKAELSHCPRPYIFFSPAGDNDKFRKGRIWPFDKWNKLGKRLLEKFGGTVFVVGSPDEKELHEKYIDIKNAEILSGKLSLYESMHYFSIADLFISGDSGPLHMASALDVNTLGLYGSTPPSLCGPYGPKGHTVNTAYPCKNCSKKNCQFMEKNEVYTHCMTEIPTERVFNYIVENNLL